MKIFKPLIMAALVGASIASVPAMAQMSSSTTTSTTNDQSNRNGASPNQRGTYNPQTVPPLPQHPGANSSGGK